MNKMMWRNSRYVPFVNHLKNLPRIRVFNTHTNKHLHSLLLSHTHTLTNIYTLSFSLTHTHKLSLFPTNIHIHVDSKNIAKYDNAPNDVNVQVMGYTHTKDLLSLY